MPRLQLIGIKINLESFATTILTDHMLNRHQLHLFLWVSKQWGFTKTKTKIVLPISMKNLYGVFVTHISGDMLPDPASVYVDDGITNLRTVAEAGSDYYLIIGV